MSENSNWSRPWFDWVKLEQQVIGVLWTDLGTEMTVRQVAEHFPDHAYTTVLTILDRLEHKGMVRRIEEAGLTTTWRPPVVRPTPPR